MTKDTTDMPERLHIRFGESSLGRTMRQFQEKPFDGGTAYIRADKYEALKTSHAELLKVLKDIPFVPFPGRNAIAAAEKLQGGGE